MKLSYFKDPHHSNFGDELNAWMWPKVLPDFFDDNDDVVFLGIGSIISDKQVDNSEYRPDQKKIIFGSGHVPSYHKAPDVHKGDWDVLFVRGPRTAKALGVSPELAVGDSAILLRTLIDFEGKRTRNKIGFMPHWKSLERGQWEEVCKKAGIHLIDPREPVEDVLDALLACDFIVTEAMHGAIVGDALRVPWIAATPLDPAHRGKWHDWAEALNIQLCSHMLINPVALIRRILSIRNFDGKTGAGFTGAKQ